MAREQIELPDIKLPLFFKLWFGFCALLGIGTVVGIGYVVYKVCQHFGIM